MPSDEDLPTEFKPQNVTEEAAEGYLVATGWIKDVFLTAAEDPKKWIPPHAAAGRKFTRGQAVMRQFKSDFASLVFVMNHVHPDLLVLLIPPSVIEKVQKMVQDNLPKPPDQPAN